jgi:hypothetical protein
MVMAKSTDPSTLVALLEWQQPGKSSSKSHLKC